MASVVCPPGWKVLLRFLQLIQIRRQDPFKEFDEAGLYDPLEHGLGFNGRQRGKEKPFPTTVCKGYRVLPRPGLAPASHIRFHRSAGCNSLGAVRHGHSRTFDLSILDVRRFSATTTAVVRACTRALSFSATGYRVYALACTRALRSRNWTIRVSPRFRHDRYLPFRSKERGCYFGSREEKPWNRIRLL